MLRPGTSWASRVKYFLVHIARSSQPPSGLPPNAFDLLARGCGTQFDLLVTATLRVRDRLLGFSSLSSPLLVGLRSRHRGTSLYIPPTTPTNPPLLMRPTNHTEQQRHADEPDTGAATRNPASSGIEPVADQCARSLSQEYEDHVGCVDAVACFGRCAVDGGSVRDLRGLDADVLAQSLDYGASNCECPCVLRDSR